jgi:hypothetical protein
MEDPMRLRVADGLWMKIVLAGALASPVLGACSGESPAETPADSEEALKHKHRDAGTDAAPPSDTHCTPGPFVCGDSKPNDAREALCNAECKSRGLACTSIDLACDPATGVADQLCVTCVTPPPPPPPRPVAPDCAAGQLRRTVETSPRSFAKEEAKRRARDTCASSCRGTCADPTIAGCVVTEVSQFPEFGDEIECAACIACDGEVRTSTCEKTACDTSCKVAGFGNDVFHAGSCLDDRICLCEFDVTDAFGDNVPTFTDICDGRVCDAATLAEFGEKGKCISGTCLSEVTNRPASCNSRIIAVGGSGKGCSL